MKRVLVAVSAGGHAMRRYVHDTVVAARERYTLRALAPEREAQGLRPLGIPVESWRPAGLFNVLRSIGALRRTVERYDPEVVFAIGWTATAVTLGALPSRYASRTFAYLQDPIRAGEMPKNFVDNRLPELLPRAGSIVVAYEKLRRGIVSGFGVPADNVRLDPPGVLSLTPPDLARAPGRRGPIVGYVGALDAERAWEVAIDALAIVARQYPDARLWFANDGRVAGLVRAYARSVNAIDAITFYDDLPAAELFAGIDMLAVPRMRDGLPYALLEALASGIPVVAANADGIGETLAPWAGYLVGDDAAGMAAGIVRAWTEIDAAWTAAAAQRERAEAAFDRAAVLERTFTEWDRLASLTRDELSPASLVPPDEPG